MRSRFTRPSRRLTAVIAGLSVTALALAMPTLAQAHPDHDNGGGSFFEQFPGEGVVASKQHDGDSGHLPARRNDVRVIGKAQITNPSGDGITGRVADVSARKGYAYLTAYFQPSCEAGGVHVMDIRNLRQPVEVKKAFIPTSPGSFTGEGSQVIKIGKRDVLIHNNETCDPELVEEGKAGGISLWDVTNPRSPQPLALHAGDKDDEATANTVHSMYAWRNALDGKTYVALVDNEELQDVDIMDISRPKNPVMVNDTLDLVELFGVDQESPEGLTSIFSHDMMVYRVGERYVMTTNYWDGGYVLLDVTNPDPGKVKLITESDYAALDEERLKRGVEISPEGNAHQSELSPNRNFMIGTDEDFNPFRGIATTDDGPYAGTEYTAASASDTPAIRPENPMEGDTTFVGRACTTDQPPASGTGIALVERGACSFQEKLDNNTAAGYSGGIVFNNAAGCDALVSMLAAGDIPFVFVARTTGLQLLNQADTACTTTTPAPGADSASTTVSSIFDGWGYVRLFRTDIPNKGKGSIKQLDTYAIQESQDRRFADDFGDLSVHEVAMDPDGKRAYLSYYSGGFRVVEYGRQGIKEVGAFIDEGGSNFWGVEMYKHRVKGTKRTRNVVLASDRDYGLYVLKHGESAGGGGPRQPIDAVLKGRNTGPGVDKLKVVTTPRGVADGARVNLYRFNKQGVRVLVESSELNANGIKRFQVADLNGRKYTKYVARVKRTDDSKGVKRTNRKRVR